MTVLKSFARGETLLVFHRAQRRLYILKKLTSAVPSYHIRKDLQHPALPTIFYVLDTAEGTWVVEAYVQGQTLDAVLRDRGPLPEADVQRLMRQLASCLVLLHAHHLIHRDIKPENLMYGDNGQLYLLDFDAARRMDEKKERDTDRLGTQGYAPPEQYGVAQTDQRSDIYAVGVTMRELLGRTYRGALNRVIERCTRIDPAQRVASAEELLLLLSPVPCWRRKACAAALTAAVILFGGLFILWTRQMPQENVPPTTSSTPAEGASDAGAGDAAPDVRTDGDRPAALSSDQTPPGVPTEREGGTVDASGIRPVDISFYGSGYNFMEDATASVSVMYPEASQWLEGRSGSRFLAPKTGSGVGEFHLENHAAVPVKNPTVTVTLQDALMFEGDTEMLMQPGGTKMIYTYGGRDPQTGMYQTVRCDWRGGEVPAGSRITFFFDALFEIFVVGPHPAVTVTCRADAMEPIVLRYSFSVDR